MAVGQVDLVKFMCLQTEKYSFTGKGSFYCVIYHLNDDFGAMSSSITNTILSGGLMVKNLYQG